MVTTDEHVGIGITGDPSGFSHEDDDAVAETELADD
jgi:glyceraldehyde-3-phosphate dehydrogenase (NAD(P))